MHLCSPKAWSAPADATENHHRRRTSAYRPDATVDSGVISVNRWGLSLRKVLFLQQYKHCFKDTIYREKPESNWGSVDPHPSPK